MASLSLKELVQAIQWLEQDPFVVYRSIQDVFGSTFLEKVFFKQYANLINENAEPNFTNAIAKIQESLESKLSDLRLYYVRLIESERASHKLILQ